jgi:glycine cleavage system H protein
MDVVMHALKKLKWALLGLVTVSSATPLADTRAFWFTQDHAWIRVDGQMATIGFTQYAINQMGEVKFVELAKIGTILDGASELVVVETSKAATEIILDIGGTVAAINPTLAKKPWLISDDPLNSGWLLKVEGFDTEKLSRLLNREQYDMYAK